MNTAYAPRIMRTTRYAVNPNLDPRKPFEQHWLARKAAELRAEGWLTVDVARAYGDWHGTFAILFCERRPPKGT